MEKAYRFFPWLSIEQASRWLRQLTGTELDIFETLQLCEFGEVLSTPIVKVGAEL